MSSRPDASDLLTKLSGGNQRAADALLPLVSEFRLFGGLTSDETARILGVSARTVERDWEVGQAWLRREMSKGATE
ncbi:MAG: ECF-type sigma factor [Phycisphaerae bacterium]